MIYNEQGMSIDPKRNKAIKELSRQEEKKAVKSFLQTTQFLVLFMMQGAGRKNSDIVWPLWQLTSKNVELQWTDDCEIYFKEIKKWLCLGKVLAN